MIRVRVPVLFALHVCYMQCIWVHAAAHITSILNVMNEPEQQSQTAHLKPQIDNLIFITYLKCCFLWPVISSSIYGLITIHLVPPKKEYNLQPS
jgi:hypothetical protein